MTKEHIRIEVGEFHITHGNRHSCMTCPIALALRSAGFADATVGSLRGHFRERGRVVVFVVGDSLTAVIRAFDADGKIRPFVMIYGRSTRLLSVQEVAA